MNRASTSVLVFSIYYLIAGILYLLLPGFVSGRLDVAAEGIIWVRFAGLLLGVMGYFFLQASRGRVTLFFRWTVHTRIGTAIVFALLWILGLAESIVLLFAVIDLAGAGWTAWTLRAE